MVEENKDFEDFVIDYVFEKGKKFPTKIVVKLMKGEKLLEEKEYGQKED